MNTCVSLGNCLNPNQQRVYRVVTNAACLAGELEEVPCPPGWAVP